MTTSDPAEQAPSVDAGIDVSRGTPSSTAQRPPRNVTSVGGLVFDAERQMLLLVQMRYGPTQGRWMIPGGLVDPGETLDVAVVREVREETSVAAEPIGIVGIRSRRMGLDNDTYIIWLLRPATGGDGAPAAGDTPQPQADGREIEIAQWMPLTLVVDDPQVAYLVRYLAQQLAAGALQSHTYVTDYEQLMPGVTDDDWKLFL